MATPKTAFNYTVGTQAVMFIMSIVLVVAALLNLRVYDTAATFRSNDGNACSPASCVKLLGMTPNQVDMFNSAAGMVGALGVGVYTMALASYGGKAAAGDFTRGKSSGVYSSVLAFVVAVVLVGVGVIMFHLPDEIATYKSEEEAKMTKACKHVGPVVMALGAAIPVLYAAKFGLDARTPGLVGGMRRAARRATHYTAPAFNDTLSTFFTY